MKVRTGLLMLVVATGALWAQSTPTPAPAASGDAPQATAAPAAGTTTAKPTAKKKSSKKSLDPEVQERIFAQTERELRIHN